MSDPLYDKLGNWEAPPPPGAWQFIARELSEMNAEKQLAARMLASEIPPPDSTWSKLKEDLQENLTKPVQEISGVPVRPLTPYLIRYGAAAALIGFLAWIFVERPFQPAEAITTSILPQESAGHSPSPARPSMADPAPPELATSQPQPSPTGVLAQHLPTEPGRNRRVPKHASIRHYPANQYWQASANEPVPIQNTAPLQELPVQNRDPRYITISNPEGRPVRISAKFAAKYLELFQASGEQSLTSQNLLKYLEAQVLHSPYAPDPANLFDLIRLKELLSEQ